MKTKSPRFYLTVIALIIWIIYSWIKGPTQASIDSKFTCLPIDSIQYVTEYYPGGILVSGKINDIEYTKEELNHVIFSLNGNRNEDVINAITSYYKPYMTSITDTLKRFNKDIQQAKIDQIQLNTQRDTVVYGNLLKIEMDIWPSKKILFRQSDKRYLQLSLNAFEDINKKYRGAAPQDINKFMEVSEKITSLFRKGLTAKILQSDTAKQTPLIYEILEGKNNVIVRDENAFSELESYQYEDTDFMIWYKRDSFLTTSSFILIVLIYTFFDKKKKK